MRVFGDVSVNHMLDADMDDDTEKAIDLQVSEETHISLYFAPGSATYGTSSDKEQLQDFINAGKATIVNTQGVFAVSHDPRASPMSLCPILETIFKDEFSQDNSAFIVFHTALLKKVEANAIRSTDPDAAEALMVDIGVIETMVKAAGSSYFDKYYNPLLKLVHALRDPKQTPDTVCEAMKANFFAVGGITEINASNGAVLKAQCPTSMQTPAQRQAHFALIVMEPLKGARNTVDSNVGDTFSRWNPDKRSKTPDSVCRKVATPS